MRGSPGVGERSSDSGIVPVEVVILDKETDGLEESVEYAEEELDCVFHPSSLLGTAESSGGLGWERKYGTCAKAPVKGARSRRRSAARGAGIRSPTSAYGALVHHLLYGISGLFAKFSLRVSTRRGRRRCYAHVWRRGRMVTSSVGLSLLAFGSSGVRWFIETFNRRSSL